MASWRTKAGGRGFALGSHARSMRGRGPCGCSCQERCSQRRVCPTPRAQQSQGSPHPPALTPTPGSPFTSRPLCGTRPRSRLLNDGFRETPGEGASCAHRGRPGSAALRGRMNATRERPRRNAYVSSFVLPNHRLPRAARVAASLRSAQPAGAPQSGASCELAAQELSAHAHGHVHAHAHVPAVRTHLGLLHALHTPWGSQGARLRQPASPRSPRYEASGRTAEPRAPQRWLH